MITLLLALSLAVSPVELYNRGNELYNQGQYAQAIEHYQEALKTQESYLVRYNLGNAYFKDGQLGRAVIQYRRALALAPRDGDVRHNLDFVRSYRIDKPLVTAGPIENLLFSVFHFFSATEAATLASLLFLTASALASLFVIKRIRLFLYLGLVPLLAFIYFLITMEVWAQERRSNPAVVVAKEVSALSGPGRDYKEILLLHDGTEVDIREIRGDYLLVQLPGGVGGWVSQQAVERIY